MLYQSINNIPAPERQLYDLCLKQVDNKSDAFSEYVDSFDIEDYKKNEIKTFSKYIEYVNNGNSEPKVSYEEYKKSPEKYK